MKINTIDQSLSKNWQIFLSLLSFFIVAFGQPARSPLLGLFAACFGYAIFWRVILGKKEAKQRFFLATFWFTAIQLVQLSWMLSHPFFYIYGPYVLFSFLQGVQFGLISLLVTPEKIIRYRTIFTVAALWVLMEWSRLYFLSGYSWNPSGMALTGNIYSLQIASFFGIFGLSFWVIFVNLLGLKSLIEKKFLIFMLAASIPYFYGWIHFELHELKNDQQNHFTAVLVQPSFPVDGSDHIRDRKTLIAYVTEQWKHILQISKKQHGKKIDLVVLPEYVVPFGTYTAVFPYEIVKNIFSEVFGKETLQKLPPLEEHLSQQFKTAISDEPISFVNNAYWLQALANVFEAPIIAGLEDVDDIALNQRKFYSAALYLEPGCKNCSIPLRYEKRVLVPLGEYIPFSFCKQLAMRYGVTGSFTRGELAKVFSHPKTPFGASICYEETFGHIMRESSQNGAKMLVNLTNDGWFPGSLLTKQHFDHARLRSVECGIPLLRACNTGITGGFDSFGRVVSTLQDTKKNHEFISDSLFIEMPMHTYQTLYSKFGDHLILGFSCLVLFESMVRRLFRRK